MRKCKKIKLLLIQIVLVQLFLTISSFSQQKKEINNEWKEVLYEKNIKFKDFACHSNYKNDVFEFFNLHPLNIKLLPCHNNCAIVMTVPEYLDMTITDFVKGDSTVMIHILANEKGEAIYARVLSGNPLLRVGARKVACNTKFRENTSKRQNVLSYCFKDCSNLK